MHENELVWKSPAVDSANSYANPQLGFSTVSAAARMAAYYG